MTKTTSSTTAIEVDALDTLAIENGNDTLATPEALMSAIAAVDSAGNVTGRASATLKHVTLARFAFHAQALAVTHEGKDVLPDNLKRAAQALVWRDATGDSTPVPAKDRTTGQKSMGEYLSQFTKVATDLAYGIDHLNVDDVKSATDELREAAKASRDKAAAVLADKASREYAAWTKGLPETDKAVIARVHHLFANGQPGSAHAEVFAADIVRSSSDAK